MIAVTRLDKHRMHLNPDHIISIEETPDTVITMFNGNRFLVADRAGAIIARIIAFRSRISRRAQRHGAHRYLGRNEAASADWFNGLKGNAPEGAPAEKSNTPFHSRDY